MLDLPKRFPYTDSMKNKNTQTKQGYLSGISVRMKDGKPQAKVDGKWLGLEELKKLKA